MWWSPNRKSWNFLHVIKSNAPIVATSARRSKRSLAAYLRKSVLTRENLRNATNQQFLVLFGDERQPAYSSAEAASEPFSLTAQENRRATTVLVRTGQQRFRFHVMAQYGSKCAVCDIRQPELLKAAHICGKADKGSDDWRNGLPLCATHHDAFDCFLFAIEPATKTIQCKPGVRERDIGLREESLRPLRNSPHAEALRWRWEAAMKNWEG
jgi:putative restriction endonuclease